MWMGFFEATSLPDSIQRCSQVRPSTEHASAAVLALPFLLLAVNSCWIFTYPQTWTGGSTSGISSTLERTCKPLPEPTMEPGCRGFFREPQLHQLFAPVVANYVLHLAVYYAAIVAVYATLKRTVGQRAALIVSILMGTYSYFLFAVGWNYVDGAGAAYYAVAIVGGDRGLAIRSRAGPPRFWLERHLLGLSIRTCCGS